jgi:hypothetical protein
VIVLPAAHPATQRSVMVTYLALSTSGAQTPIPLSGQVKFPRVAFLHLVLEDLKYTAFYGKYTNIWPLAGTAVVRAMTNVYEVSPPTF